MRHSVEWQDDAVNASPEERATVGDLRLCVSGQNVTTHILEGTVADHVTVALYGLVDGLAHDWWSVFGSRDREFSLTRYRTGYLLPDIRLQFDGAVLEITAHERAYTDPDLRFWGATPECLSRDEGEASLSSLIEHVLARLKSQGLPETGAALRWRRVQSSRVSGERDFCEAAGSLGLDPYDIPNDVAAFIERAEGIFENEALVEFVAGAKGVDQSRLIDWVIDATTRAGEPSYRLADLRPIVDEISKSRPLRSMDQAWAAGYRRARAMRRALGFGQHIRVASFGELARRLGAPQTYALAQPVDGINALRREASDGTHVHIRNHGEHAGAAATHLFALARAIGDAACFPATSASPINRVPKAYRQAAGRAFAAEFLAPIDEIQSMRQDKHDVDSIADEFGVATMVVDLQLENRERIAQACA